MDPKLQARIRSAPFPFTQETWNRPKTPTQICLHHTASGPGVDGDINWWKQDGTQVSTPLIVGRDGIAVQIYPSARWAYTLGLNHAYRGAVEAATIGLEIDTWGWLTKDKAGKFWAWPKDAAGKFTVEIPASEVCDLGKPWKGMQYFHKYTPEQIETTRLLLIHWNAVYGIPLKYREAEMWQLSQNAIYAKAPGIYTHASFREDKWDIHPQPDMVAMLKGLAA